MSEMKPVYVCWDFLYHFQNIVREELSFDKDFCNILQLLFLYHGLHCIMSQQEYQIPYGDSPPFPCHCKIISLVEGMEREGHLKDKFHWQPLLNHIPLLCVKKKKQNKSVTPDGWRAVCLHGQPSNVLVLVSVWTFRHWYYKNIFVIR